MATTNLNISLDAELKKQAEALFSELGLSMTTAMNVFLRQAVRQGKIPFEIAVDRPNAETILAIEESEDMLSGKIPMAKTYSNAREMFEDMGI